MRSFQVEKSQEEPELFSPRWYLDILKFDDQMVLRMYNVQLFFTLSVVKPVEKNNFLTEPNYIIGFVNVNDD